jgi:hypothetical protein
MEPARGADTIRSIVASTASKNSMPRCSRRAWYQRPASRYSASASSSKRTRGFTVREARLQRDGVRRPMALHPARPPARGGPAARLRRPKQLRRRLDARPPRRRGWPGVRRPHPRVRQGAGPMPRAADLALVTSWGHSTPTGSPGSPTPRWSRRREADAPRLIANVDVTSTVKYVGMLAPRDEAPVAFAQADLGFPSEIVEGLGQLVDPLLDVRGDLGGMAICPGGFHQDAAPLASSSWRMAEGWAASKSGLSMAERRRARFRTWASSGLSSKAFDRIRVVNFAAVEVHSSSHRGTYVDAALAARGERVSLDYAG